MIQLNRLRAACVEGEVSKVPGFGKKTEENYLTEIDILGTREGKFPIWQMEKVVLFVEEELQSNSGNKTFFCCWELPPNRRREQRC